eukprot:scaffold624_cov176-Amphora_coffeaeformis.AAC.4
MFSGSASIEQLQFVASNMQNLVSSKSGGGWTLENPDRQTSTQEANGHPTVDEQTGSIGAGGEGEA